jgi:NAD-dependent dihydropyrimidine dehydrogenase PreA subunit
MHMPRSSDPFYKRLGFREWIRLLFVGSLLVAAWRFLLFARYVTTAAGTPVGRPTAADAFLPLGGLAALKAWVSTGYFDRLHPAALVVLIATLVTAWLFRRALCSWLCPVGMLSEYLARFGRRIAGRNVELPRWLDRTLIGLKYAGTFGVLLWLFAQPPGVAIDFMRTPFYTVADMKLFQVYAQLGVGIIATVGSLVAASIFIKGFWCRYLCPYGALQGIFGVLGPISLVKDDATCTSCGKCNRVCPNAVDVRGASAIVTSSECMGCGSCVSACPKAGTLRFAFLGRTEIEPVFLGALFLVVFFGVVAVAAAAGHWSSMLTPQDYRLVLQLAPNVRLPL